MPDDGPRIAPLDPPYEPEIEKFLNRAMGGRTENDPLKLFRTWAVNDEMAGRGLVLGAGILGKASRVPPLLREVMIDRTCALTGAEYEWGVHIAVFAEEVGLSDEQVASTVTGSHTDPCWDAVQASVFRLADELHEHDRISDELYAELERHLSADQIIELTITAGWYHAISWLIAVCGVEREPWAARFPEARAA